MNAFAISFTGVGAANRGAVLSFLGPWGLEFRQWSGSCMEICFKNNTWHFRQYSAHCGWFICTTNAALDACVCGLVYAVGHGTWTWKGAKAVPAASARYINIQTYSSHDAGVIHSTVRAERLFICDHKCSAGCMCDQFCRCCWNVSWTEREVLIWYSCMVYVLCGV